LAGRGAVRVSILEKESAEAGLWAWASASREALAARAKSGSGGTAATSVTMVIPGLLPPPGAEPLDDEARRLEKDDLRLSEGRRSRSLVRTLGRCGSEAPDDVPGRGSPELVPGRDLLPDPGAAAVVLGPLRFVRDEKKGAAFWIGVAPAFCISSDDV